MQLSTRVLKPFDEYSFVWNNLSARLVQEQMVLQVQPVTVPTDSVVSAVRCLPPQALDKVYNEVEDKQYSFRHWTIRDYAQAYISGRLTPIQVKLIFLH